ncbi:major facilitator superfamily domain-containing protein [Colletotrichum godetiae]|uniref:Major facilitator superfamily domain-containing protein n=1 Tax=Colletotrichum godetiae TaxID=1209918 RepID=A0AAJ0EWJ4_9PEZI|nr:major facilitator superfamily domain-containing protein [Colletotrichum godetiae]KAK1689979.1 major facilitator superfamily domain-containing protein [Colletotrichum godetiae]
MTAQSTTVTVRQGTPVQESTSKEGNLLNTEGHLLGSNEDVTGGLPAPTTTAAVVQKWNHPRSNLFRVLSCFWSLLVSGANDAAYGALIPYLEIYYDLTYVVVSLVFLSPFIGYVLSAVLNNYVHLKLGQRGIAVIASACHIVAYIIISQHPPYPALVAAFVIAGFGNGLSDAGWNAYIGNMARANEVLGFLHASYGVGGVIAPLIATTMINKANLGWWNFYYFMVSIMPSFYPFPEAMRERERVCVCVCITRSDSTPPFQLGLACIELVWCTAAFWPQTGAVYRELVNRSRSDAPGGGLRTALFKRPYARVSWLCALFLLAYVGTEVSLGGWIVQFMIQVRKANNFDSGMTSVGFWLGITLGRAVLGFVTPKLGIKLAVSIYIPIAMALELVFWLVPHFYVSAVAVALQGFFLGPFFPAVVVAATKLLPRHLHVSTIGFAAAFGGSGAAILPFAVGALAQAKGVQVLQPIILAFLGIMLVFWLCLPRIGRKQE